MTNFSLSYSLSYSGQWLNRAHQIRQNPQWVKEVQDKQDSLFIPLWHNQCFLALPADAPIILSQERFQQLSLGSEPFFLGLDQEQAVFAVDLSAIPQAVALQLLQASMVIEIRALLGKFTAKDGDVLAYARGLLYWHRRQQFCGVCGQKTISKNGGHFRACVHQNCSTLFFPQIAPAVIMLVELPGNPVRCLLARHQGSAEGRYSTLAGFVDIGESLENAVKREVMEEAGLVVTQVTYQASQAWPFPAGLMVGFRAQAASSAFVLDKEELVEARWFSVAELQERLQKQGSGHVPFSPDSIEKFLVENWVNDHS